MGNAKNVTLPPAPEVKVGMLRQQLRSRGLRTFVETGTFYGDTVAAMVPLVDYAFTTEVDPDLCGKATARFKNEPKVEVHLGDSADVLPKILSRLTAPALFWLDAHYIGPRLDASFTEGFGPEPKRGKQDTPIMEELRAVLAGSEDPNHIANKHVIAVDDARLFGFDPAYPHVGEVLALAMEHKRLVDVVLDVIWIGPPDMEVPVFWRTVEVPSVEEGANSVIGR